jgi:tetratricopeptide (TPR) repeat protein
MYLTLGQQAREKGDLDEAEDSQNEALVQFEKALELEPGNAFTMSNIGNVYKELANVYEAEGDEEGALAARKQAVELYHQALQTEDRRHEVQLIWLNLGGIFIDAGYFGQAIDYLDEFLKAYPQDPRGNYWMGYSLAETGEFQKAVPFLEKAVRAKPTVDAWSQLALSYGYSGQLKKGIDGYTKILSVVPNSIEAHYQIGLLYRKAGNTEMALKHLNRALVLNPDGEHSEHIRSILTEDDRTRFGVQITEQEEI